MEETLKLCAYNQTSQCFLGLHIVAAEFSDASFDQWVLTLTPNSHAGLWIVPFRGLPESAVPFLVDLVYLDQDCRIIDVVESYPAFRVTTSSRAATSVLVLPIRSIDSSQTKPGDQLVICVAEVLERRLRRTSSSIEVPATAAQSARFLGEHGTTSAPVGPPPVKDCRIEAGPKSRQQTSPSLSEPGKKRMGPLMSWLHRSRSQDSRKAPREASPHLAAYFWTGAAPEAHIIRDISTSGLYVLTNERWYLGTTIRVMLTKTDTSDLSSERSICVHSRAVRWGNDGVGLQFVLKDGQKLRRGETALEDGADRKGLDLFLKQLGGQARNTPAVFANEAI